MTSLGTEQGWAAAQFPVHCVIAKKHIAHDRFRSGPKRNLFPHLTTPLVYQRRCKIEQISPFQTQQQ